MDEARLLIFRWGAKEYGISVAAEIGVIGKTSVNRRTISEHVEESSSLQGRPIPILDVDVDFKTEDNKFAIIIQSNGVQFAIMVDEVIKVIEVPNSNEELSGAETATFKIWQCNHK